MRVYLYLKYTSLLFLSLNQICSLSQSKPHMVFLSIKYICFLPQFKLIGISQPKRVLSFSQSQLHLVFLNPKQIFLFLSLSYINSTRGNSQPKIDLFSWYFSAQESFFSFSVLATLGISQSKIDLFSSSSQLHLVFLSQKYICSLSYLLYLLIPSSQQIWFSLRFNSE